VLPSRHLRYCLRERVRSEEAVPHASGRVEPTISKGARPPEDDVNEIARVSIRPSRAPLC
jgi:hypothetical protein